MAVLLGSGNIIRFIRTTPRGRTFRPIPKDTKGGTTGGGGTGGGGAGGGGTSGGGKNPDTSIWDKNTQEAIKTDSSKKGTILDDFFSGSSVVPVDTTETEDKTPEDKDPKADNFEKGEKELQPSDPLILDLNGDGLKTSSVTDGAFFDLDCSGFAEQTAWAGAGDGVLARDVDNDGWITDGKELFGDQTILANGNTASNGFQALADLDSNGDNKIDANDTAFTELGVIKAA